MKVGELYNYLDSLSPFSLAESWDNCGLVVGAMDDEFENVYVSLDLDLDFVQTCEPNSVVITHHPLIFSPLKKINFDSFSTKILRIAIQKNLHLIAMHTNFDKTHLNRYVFSKILGFEITRMSDDFIVETDLNIDFNLLLEQVTSKLGLEFKKFVHTHQNVKSIALTTGSGGSLISKIKADTFLTSDIKYHEAMEAKARGINLIEIGHYESEVFFDTILREELASYLQKNKLNDIIRVSQNPFSYRSIN